MMFGGVAAYYLSGGDRTGAAFLFEIAALDCRVRSGIPIFGLEQTADGQPVKDYVGASNHHQRRAERLDEGKGLAQHAGHGAFEKCHSDG